MHSTILDSPSCAQHQQLQRLRIVFGGGGAFREYSIYCHWICLSPFPNVCFSFAQPLRHSFANGNNRTADRTTSFICTSHFWKPRKNYRFIFQLERFKPHYSFFIYRTLRMINNKQLFLSYFSSNQISQSDHE